MRKAAMIGALAGALFLGVYVMPASAPPATYEIVQHTFHLVPQSPPGGGVATVDRKETVACSSGKSNVNGAFLSWEPGSDFPGGPYSNPGGGSATWLGVTLNDNGHYGKFHLQGSHAWAYTNYPTDYTITNYSVDVTVYAICVLS